MSRPVINPHSLKNFYANGKAVGFSFSINNNRYRNKPVSVLEKFVLTVDGEEIDPVLIHFCLKNKKFMVSELKDQYCEYWGMMTPAIIEVDQLGGLSDGKHTIKVKLLSRDGYMEMPLCCTDNDQPHMYPAADIGEEATLWLME